MTTAHVTDELHESGLRRLTPGAWRVEDRHGRTVARYIADPLGAIAWATVYELAPIAKEDRRRRPIGAVLELVDAGELVPVQLPNNGQEG